MDEILKYFQIANRRKWWALAVFGSVVAVSVLYTFSVTPIYEATGQLLLKRNRNTGSIGDIGEKLGQLEALGTQSSPVNTEIEVIRSLPLAEKIIEALDLKDEKGGKLEFKDFSKDLRVKNTRLTDVVEVVYKDSNPAKAANVVNKLFELYIQNDIANNRQEAQLARIFIEKQLPKVEENVKKAEVSLREFKELNQIINLPIESKAAVETIGEIKKQISIATADLASITTQSKSLQASLGMEANAAFLWGSPSIQQVLGELQQTGQRIAVEKARYQDANPVIIDLKRRQVTLEALLEERVGQEMAAKLKQRDRASQINITQQELVNNFVRLETERLGLIAKTESLSRLLQAFQARTVILPKLEQQQGALERRLKVAQSTYEILLTRLQNVKVAENQTVGNVRIIAPAVAPDLNDQVFPRKSLTIGIGVLFGFILAALAVTILEIMDRSIKTIDEIRDLSSYPIIGIIPDFANAKTRKKLLNGLHQNNSRLHNSQVNNSQNNGAIATYTSSLIVRDAPRSPISESFRILQTNLQFSNSDNNLKVIVITSSVPQEGKSTTAANLALTFADLGKRVLIIDVDMRRPSQQKIWQIDNKIGLSSVLTDQKSLDDAKQNIIKNLDVVTSGPIPPNPVTLIQSKRMAEIVEMAAQEYDLVILDSPPVTVAADASILGKIGNGILLVVRPEVADSSSFSHTRRVFEQSDQNVLGMVINGVTIEHNSYSYSHPSNYYGEGEENKKSTSVL